MAKEYGVVTQPPKFRQEAVAAGVEFIDAAVEELREALYYRLSLYEFAQDRASVFALKGGVYRLRRLTQMVRERPGRLTTEGAAASPGGKTADGDKPALPCA